MPWLAISLELEPAPAEALSEALLDAGVESVALDPLEEPATRVRVTALAAAGTNVAQLVESAARAAALPPPAFTAGEVADEDWVQRSQAQFGPICVTPSLWIVPSWHEPPDPHAVVVRLDPGLAFGTGSHASTRLVLQSLGKNIKTGDRVLDYGCGSGILAIVAARLGAGEVSAVDIDPQALATTAGNARSNGVRLQVALPGQLPAGSYDMILANILAGPLIALEPLFAARARRGGRILLSGILQSQADEVMAAYASDFHVSVGAVEEGWAMVEGLRR